MFFFQAEDGIRDAHQGLEFRRVLFRSLASALWARIEKAQDKEQAVAQASAIVAKMADKRVALDVLEQALHPSVRSLPVAHLALADAAWAASEQIGRAHV